MEEDKVELYMSPDGTSFKGTATGNKDTIATMIFSFLTHNPEIMKKVFKKYLDCIYGDDDDE